jgi:twitching motility protein PilT
VSRRIDAFFDGLLSKGGSDLHVSIGYPPLARVRGELVPLREAAMSRIEVEETLLEILDADQKRKITEELDLDFAHSYESRARFRANYFYKLSGLAAVFRVIPTKVPTLAELGCPDVVRRLAERRAGLVLVTGPTGSGKSTTLAAMINHINESFPRHVLTIEDPVEFVHEPKKSQITHREVGQHASSFQAAIRSAGREDADVILVGELRNNETMRLALQLASFGILVFATVHTNSAAATIDRICNSFPAEEQPQVRGMLAESLAGIVAQQLVRSRDGKRCAAQEILVGSSAVAQLIRDGKTFQLASLMQAGQSQGMQTTDLALERLMNEGRIDPVEALEHASDKEAMQRVVARIRPDLAGPLVG